MIRLRQAVVVEGKYDKIALEGVIDAVIIPTDGFRIFKDREKRDFLRALALRDGIIVMTDSDSAGMLIRSYLKKICGDGRIINIYIPQLPGRERRKEKAGKQGLLGVEGMSRKILLEALERGGVTALEADEPVRRVTKRELYQLGLSGGENSAAKRAELSVLLGLPRGMSSNAFLDAVNAAIGYDEFMRLTEDFRKQ